MTYHQSVLLSEVIDYLRPQSNQVFVDCTLGEGGHAEAILERTGPRGILLGLDVDTQAISEAQARLVRFGERLIAVKSNFRDLKACYEQRLSVQVDGIVCDLGISRRHVESEGYGISFQKDEPLLMRLSGAADGITAFDVVNQWDEVALADMFWSYGEERRAQLIAKAIINARQASPVRTTGELARIIEKVHFPYRRASSARSRTVGTGRGNIHPATRAFQALRIAVNDEMGSLKALLPQAIDILSTGGRMAIITFHSLEDRLVKRFFKEAASCHLIKLVNKKVIKPDRTEILANRRSRSAKLRVIEKLSPLPCHV